MNLDMFDDDNIRYTDDLLNKLSERLKCPVENIPEKIKKLQTENFELARKIKRFKKLEQIADQVIFENLNSSGVFRVNVTDKGLEKGELDILSNIITKKLGW